MTALTAGNGKNPAAVELGRRGGLKGGRARADALTPEQRKEIARKAAQARWGRQRQRQPGRGVNKLQSDIAKARAAIERDVTRIEARYKGTIQRWRDVIIDGAWKVNR